MCHHSVSMSPCVKVCHHSVSFCLPFSPASVCLPFSLARSWLLFQGTDITDTHHYGTVYGRNEIWLLCSEWPNILPTWIRSNHTTINSQSTTSCADTRNSINIGMLVRSQQGRQQSSFRNPLLPRFPTDGIFMILRH